jgi:chromosomal replication initiator protein
MIVRELSWRPAPVARIKILVARSYRIPVRKMVEHDRAYRVSHPRQVAMYLAKRNTQHSYLSLRRFFGNRNHTTIIHGVRAVEQRRREDPKLDKRIKRLERRL